MFHDDSVAAMFGDPIGTARSQRAKQVVISATPEEAANRFHSMALLDDIPAEDFATDLDGAKQKVRQTLLRCPDIGTAIDGISMRFCYQVADGVC